ncbi:MAG: F0F1 ATP synthase subunit delta [Alphaproteobacteria bacterium]|nr:F0F1 ATP synthase subunit delta [Alphaproteobacteria bacterium]
MASSVSVPSVVLSRYATALIDLAEDSKSLEKVQKDLAGIEAMISESSDLRLFFESPLSGKESQTKVIEALAKKGKFNKLTTNFLGVLIQNSRLNALLGIIQAFNKICARRRGDISVRVETAVALTEKQEKDFREKISTALGVGVMVETSVDPAILGGMIVTVGSHMIDDSVRRKLERLSSALVGGANQNEVQNLKEVG